MKPPLWFKYKVKKKRTEYESKAEQVQIIFKEFNLSKKKSWFIMNAT